MKAISLKSPAKLNLYLKILNKRSDGYHNIITLFERISLFDDIQFKRNRLGKIRIQCDHPSVPAGRKNLVYKVAQALKEDFGVRDGVDIQIKKRIPVAAGLAGGSSNAATALIGLNKLWKLKLSQSELLSYARAIGSDVAFFLHDSSWALGTERGEKIERLKLSAKLWHIVVVPKVKLYARDVYNALKMRASPKSNVGSTNVLTTQKDNVIILLRHLRKNDLLGVGGALLNDLERPILSIYPNLSQLKERLKSLNVKGVMISGSGPAVFGITASERQAQEIKTILTKRFSQVFVVKTV